MRSAMPFTPFPSGIGKSLEFHSESFGRVDGCRCHSTRFFALFRAILSLIANFKIFYMVLLSTKMPEIALFSGVLSDFLPEKSTFEPKIDQKALFPDS